MTFAPSDISGLEWWLDAADLNANGDGNTGYSDGTAVATWKDKSGNVRDAAQATGSKQPTQQSGAGDTLNGHPVVRFDGGDILAVANFATTTVGAVFAVYKMDAGASTAGAIVASGDESSSAMLALKGFYSSTYPYASFYSEPGPIERRGAISTASGAHVAMWRSNGDIWQLRVDGANDSVAHVSGAETSYSTWFGGVAARDNVTVGGYKRSAEGWYLLGDVAEVLVYGVPLTSAEVQAIEAYLAAKWGVTITTGKALSATMAHAAAALTTPTYDTSGEVVHPDVYDAGAGNTWHGHRYWMAITPYPAGNPAYENPSILVSDDGTTWTVPAGLTNPIDPAPGGGAYDSDPELLHAQDDKLYLFYRQYGSGSDIIVVRSSDDGITWSAESQVFVAGSGTGAVSPTVVWDGTRYVMWYLNAHATPYILERRTSATLPSGWSAPDTCTLIGVPAGWDAWHIDIILVSGIYRAIILLTAAGATGGGPIIHASSTDGLAWTLDDNTLLDPSTSAWDNGGIYRATFEPLSTTTYDVWYSGFSSATPHAWHMGRSTMHIDGSTDVVIAAATPTVSTYSQTSASLAWAAATGGSSPYSYQVQRAPDSGGIAGTFANVGAPQSGLTYTDGGLAAATKYWWRVVATDSNNIGGTSGTVSVTTLAAGGVTIDNTTLTLTDGMTTYDLLAGVTIDNTTLTLTDGVTTYDLLAGVLKLRYGGWEMQSPLPEGETTLQGYGAAFEFSGYQPITETFALYAAAAATELQIRQARVSIDKIFEQARRWHKNHATHTKPAWLTFGTSAETARRCLIYGGNCVMLSGNGAQPLLTHNNALAQLTITRHPLWEDAAPATILASTAYTTCGGFTDSLTQPGTAPGRIAQMTLMPDYPHNTTPLTKAWVGILDQAHIVRTSFLPRWPLTSGVLSATYGATSVADADGIGANVVQIDFDTGPHADLHERLTISTSNIDAYSPHWSQYQGVFRILCRCRVTAATGTTAGIILKWGGAASANLQEATEVTVANTVYSWVDLGECTIPAVPFVSDSTWALNMDHMFHVFAERLAGTGDLFVDHVVLMPAVHMALLQDTVISSDNPFFSWAVAACDANDTPFCWNYDNEVAGIASVPNMAPRDLFFPCYTGGIAVVVAERAAGSVETDNIKLGFSTVARWLSYRDT